MFILLVRSRILNLGCPGGVHDFEKVCDSPVVPRVEAVDSTLEASPKSSLVTADLKPSDLHNAVNEVSLVLVEIPGPVSPPLERPMSRLNELLSMCCSVVVSSHGRCD